MKRGETLAWACALIGLAGAAIGWIVAPDRFASAWLSALVTWLLWPLGALTLLLTHSLTGGRWGDAARPGFLVGIGTLPLLIPGVVPILLLLPALYPWARPERLGHVKNGFWLNPPFFTERMIFYVIVWLGIGLIAGLRSRRGRSLGNFAAPALIVLALTFTFASVDLTLSLEDFNSNIYGMIRAASAGLLALSITALIVPATQEVRADFAKLLLALVILWTYLDFMQLLIVWQSSLATDSGWYVRRTTPYWGGLALVIEGFRFVVPFLVLVFPQAQHSRLGLGFICLLLIVTTILRSWWLVLPASGHLIGLLDLACMLGFCGLSSGLACRHLARLRVHQKAMSHV